MHMKRREFIFAGAAAVVVTSVAGVDAPTAEFHAFSRVFEFMQDMHKTAAFLKSCGYDGVEWTVRPHGFVDSATATAADLKRAKNAADEAGIKADNIVVGFRRGDEPGAERLVMHAAEAGFKRFRYRSRVQIRYNEGCRYQ